MRAMAMGFAALAWLCSGAHASDIALDVRQGQVDVESDWYFEVGVGLEYQSAIDARATGPAKSSSGGVINLGGALYYKRFFIEAAMESYDGLNLGYQLLADEHWQLDLLASSLSGEFYFEDDRKGQTADEKLVERESLYNGAGFRLTRRLGDTVLQARLVDDIYKSNGLRASVRLGRRWQRRNWQLHGIASVDYASAKTLEYLVGVGEDEATERFPAYAPDAGSAVSLELGAAKPLSQDVVWSTRLLYTRYSDEVAQSPLVTDDDYIGFRTLVSYVF